MSNILTPVFRTYTAAEFSQYAFLPNVQYRDVLAEICSQLAANTDIKYFYLLLSSPWMKSLCLGNTPHWSVTYHQYTLSRLDATLVPPPEAQYMITDNITTDPLSALFYTWLETYGIYEIYSIVRYADELKIVAIAHTDHRIVQSQAFYQKTLHEFEDFTDCFIEATTPIIYACRPLMKMTPFMQDCDYRKAILKQTLISIPPTLSLREKQILLHAFHGNSAKEIARILSLEHRTVEKYADQAKKKLNAKNMTHALKRAIDLGLIQSLLP